MFPFQPSKGFHFHAVTLTLLWVCAFSPSLAAQTWVPTATQGLAGLLANATQTGPLPAATTLHIAVALRLNHQASLVHYVQTINDPSSPLFGSSLTVSEFVASYAPTSAEVESVVNYLTSQGFSNIQVEPNNLFVTADGTAAAIGAAFFTSIVQFEQNNRIVYANLTAAQVPSSLGATVLAVLGLNNAGIMTTPIQTQAASSVTLPSVHFYPPQGFWQAYDVGTTPAGSQTKIAIFTEGNLTQVIADLRFAEGVNGLPQVPVEVVQVGLASPDTSGQDEWDLDTQMSTGMARNVAKLILYTTTSLSDSDVALMFNKFAHQNIAKAGNASFGLCETFAFLDGSMVADDQVFLEAAAQGQTVFTSTGDNGSACPVVGVTNGVPLSGAAGMVEYPASSPYVVAVGGTTLTTDANFNYIAEVGWDAGGGGISAWEGSPFWQQPVLPTTAAGKAIPDVSMDADIVSGALVYIGCQPGEAPGNCQFIVGGTSLASPLWLGTWARLQSAHSNKLGFAPLRLYRLYQTPPATYPGFHDIVGGCNGFFCAIPGFDYVTGLGTPDVTKLNAAVQ